MFYAFIETDALNKDVLGMQSTVKPHASEGILKRGNFPYLSLNYLLILNETRTGRFDVAYYYLLYFCTSMSSVFLSPRII